MKLIKLDGCSNIADSVVVAVVVYAITDTSKLCCVVCVFNSVKGLFVKKKRKKKESNQC